MRLRRIAAIPFALVADLATLCNMGERSFTQQVFDAERREQELREFRAAAQVLREISRMAALGEARK